PCRPLEPAVPEHPLDLVGEKEHRRERRGVVGLVEARLLERDAQIEARRYPAVGGGDPLDARDRGGGAQSEPEPRVAGEALLRRAGTRGGPRTGSNRRYRATPRIGRGVRTARRALRVPGVPATALPGDDGSCPCTTAPRREGGARHPGGPWRAPIRIAHPTAAAP